MEFDKLDMLADVEGAELSPAMHRATLRFAVPALEHDYRIAAIDEDRALARFGIGLALTFYAAMGWIDLWLLSEHVAFTFAVRGTMSVASLLLLAFSYTRTFSLHADTVMSLFGIVLGGGLFAILTVVPDSLRDMYYAGFLLIGIGVFTVIGVQFSWAVAVSIVIIAMFLLSDYQCRHGFDLRTVANLTFLVAIMLIGGVNAYMAQRQRRLAHFRRRVIEQKRAHSEHASLHDALTGLPNRRLFMERLHRALARREHIDSWVAVLFIDLDGFKCVNDTRGHAFGDKLLRSAGLRLERMLRTTDSVARLGGDEFVILLEDLAGAEAARFLQQRIQVAFDEPIDIEGETVRVGISIGCALCPGDAQTARELLQLADKAMYEMKQRRSHR